MPNFFIPLDLSVRFMLVVFRVGGIIAFVPFFNHRSFPNTIKAALSIIFSFVIFPILLTQNFIAPTQILTLILAVIREVLIGIVIGFVAQLTFTGIQFGGELLSAQLGLMMATTFDPNFQEQTTLIAQLYSFFALLIFVSINGHYIFLRALMHTFRVIPLGEFQLSEEILRRVIEIFPELFTIGFYVATPALVATFMATIGLALINRAIPQINVFVLLPPTQIVIGMTIIIFSIRGTVMMFQFLFEKMGKNLDAILGVF